MSLVICVYYEIYKEMGPLSWVSYLGKPTRVRWPAHSKSWACLWPLHWHVWWIIMWHHEMAIGNDTRISWKHHGNIMGVSWQWHWEHENIMYPSERQYSVSVWFPGGWWWCSLWWVNDQPSNAMPMPCHAETLHKSLEIHPDYMKAAQYLPCTAAYHYT